jgi:serine/threonine protein kinase
VLLPQPRAVLGHVVKLRYNDAYQQAPLTDTLLTTANAWVQAPLTDTLLTAANDWVQAREEALDSKLQGLLILPEDVTRGALIGKGGYGSVFKGTLRGSQEVAIKTIELTGAMMKRDQMDIKREAYIHKQAHDHPNICKLLGVMLPSLATTMQQQHQASNEFVIVMELLHGDLAQYLNAEDELLSMEERLKLALDVAEGMAHLHSKNITHGDLKPGNLLIRKLEGEGQVQVAVSDFGLSSISCVTLCSATMAAQAIQSSSTALSLWYSPPELLDNCWSKKTPAGDVYAFGIILFEIFTGQHPGGGVAQYDVVLKNVLEGRRPVVPDDVQLPQGVQQLMSSCWDADPDARPSFDEAKHRISALLSASRL